MVLDSCDVVMDRVEGQCVRSDEQVMEPEVQTGPVKPTVHAGPTTKVLPKVSSATKKDKVSHNGLPAQTKERPLEKRSSSTKGGAKSGVPLSRPLSLEMTPQRLRGSREQMADRCPPWRSGPAAPSPPARSLTSPSLGAGGWMRRSESTCSVNCSLGPRAKRGQMRSATSLPHIVKGTGGSTQPTAPRSCLLVALRPLNLEQEKQTFFQSDFKYEPQFEYTQPEPRSVLDKYCEGSGLFLEQVPMFSISTSDLII